MNIELSKEQIHTIAAFLQSRIAAFIAEHQAEHQAYLAEVQATVAAKAPRKNSQKEGFGN